MLGRTLVPRAGWMARAGATARAVAMAMASLLLLVVPVAAQDGSEPAPFSDRSQWRTGKARQGKVAYEKGRLRFTMRMAGGSLWTWRTFASGVTVLRAEGMVEDSSGNGDAGFLCGAPGRDKAFYYAGLSSGAEIVIGSGTDSVLTEIARVPLPAGVTPSRAHRLAVECAVTGTGTDRLAVWVDGVPALDHSTTASLGILDRAALYATAQGRRFNVMFDDVTLSAGSEYRPSGESPPPAPA